MGALRLILALSVFFFHHNFGAHRGLPFSFTAVLCFFIISGFYMHMVISEKYGISGDGLRRFYLNRVLRIFPVYWAVLIGWQVAHDAGLFRQHPFTDFIGTLEQSALLPNVLWANLILQPAVADHLFMGQTYTIGMELAFYLAAPLLAVCSGRVLVATWGLSFIALLVPHWLGLAARPWQYEFIPTVFVFFVTGMCSYRLKRALHNVALPNRVIAACLAVALAGYCFWIDDAHVQEWVNRPAIFGLYALVAIAIPFFFRATNRSRVDRWLGEFSYPLYVCQGLAVTLVLGADPVTNLQRVYALIAALLAAAALVIFIERPIEALRRKITRRSVLATPLRNGERCTA